MMVGVKKTVVRVWDRVMVLFKEMRDRVRRGWRGSEDGGEGGQTMTRVRVS